ncbi:MAG: hypothetical protein Q4E76_02080 [Tissierellia bacterium]|nr:hypothetical protein [Tissierellia bacterium]
MKHVKYTLMNKNKPVLDFLYDMEAHRIVKILQSRELEFAPPAILDGNGNATRENLNNWWQRRAIPTSRCQIAQLMSRLNIESTLVLAEKNSGLSLSDRYWINDAENPQEWDKINFFDNDFPEDLGSLTLGQNSFIESPNFMSPNATVGGDLMKKWTIVAGRRVLIKRGTAFTNQEVYNEVIATMLHRRLLHEDDFVPYTLHKENRRMYCACPNMLREDEELIPALHLIHNRKKRSSQNDYQFLVGRLKDLGLDDVEVFLSKIFVCDVIMGNFDRHYQNFGVIRNVETLEYTRMAPIFDTGNSLWCNVETLDTLRDFEYIAKPFGIGWSPERQLKLFSHFQWFAPEKLDGFIAEAMEILGRNSNMPPARMEKIEGGLKLQIEKTVKHIEKM